MSCLAFFMCVCYILLTSGLFFQFALQYANCHAGAMFFSIDWDSSCRHCIRKSSLTHDALQSLSGCGVEHKEVTGFIPSWGQFDWVPLSSCAELLRMHVVKLGW